MRASNTVSLVAGCLLLVCPILSAQLQSADVVLLTSSGLTHLRSGTATAVSPVPMGGAVLPTFWGNGAIEWVPGTQTVLLGSGIAPYDLFLADFSSTISSPPIYRLGSAIGAITDIDIEPMSGDALILESVAAGNGQVGYIPGPVTATSLYGTYPPWATNLTNSNADYMALQDPNNAIIGGIANIYQVPSGSATGGVALALAAWFYSARSIDIDPVTGDLFIACFNPDYVRRLSWAGGTSYGDLGNALQQPEIDGPDDVEFDPPTQTLYCVATNGGQILGIPWGAQTGNDNAVIANTLAFPPPTGYLAVGPPGGHGNTGFFGNIAVIGNVSALASKILTGVGCSGFSLSSSLNPVIGTAGFPFDFQNGPANGAAFVFFSLGLAPAPWPISPTCVVYLDQVTLLSLISIGFSPQGPVLLSSAGTGTLSLPIPNDPSLIGQSLDTQAAVNGPAGFLTSNAMTLHFGL